MSKIVKTKTGIRYNPSNEIVKYKFFEELEHGRDCKDEKTVKLFVAEIHEFEVANGFKDFKNFDKEWAIIFKEHLNDKVSQRTGEHISKSYYLSCIKHVRIFFLWLIENEKEYAKKIKAKDIEYFNVTRNEKNQAKATGVQESHKIKDILETIRMMKEDTIIEKRNKAILSLFLLTSARISSLQKARVKSITYFEECKAWAFVQDPRLQNTKYSKKIVSFFVGKKEDVEDIENNVINWKNYLISQGVKDRGYLFPKITTYTPFNGEPIMELTKEYMRSLQSIREIVKNAFADNGLKYLKPHSFRHSIARLVAEQRLKNTSRDIAFGQNYGHKGDMATFYSSYGGQYLEEQAELVKSVRLR